MNGEVVDYIMTFYRDYKIFNISNKGKLMAEVQQQIVSSRFLMIDCLDSDLTSEKIRAMLDYFKREECQKGYLMRIGDSVDPRFVYESTSETARGKCHFRITEKYDRLPKLKLKNKVVLITGALGGIGQTTCERYRQEGWYVVGLDNKRLDSFEIKSYSMDKYHEVDLSERRLSNTFRRLLRKLPRLDSIVHLAAIQVCGSVEEVDIDKWDKLMNVNVKSIYVLAKYALPYLKQTIGNMVIVGSVHSYASSKNISMYATSKCALMGIIRNLAIEWGEYGIRVNGVAPGATQTQMLMDGLARTGKPPEEGLKQLADRHLMKRIAYPHEITNVIYFLSNGESSGITGQTIVADGGASIYLSTEVV
jgi:NAD(P)-dependent dehydrogenase (short-subunit alcohol dehydrogenase family)